VAVLWTKAATVETAKLVPTAVAKMVKGSPAVAGAEPAVTRVQASVVEDTAEAANGAMVAKATVAVAMAVVTATER